MFRPVSGSAAILSWKVQAARAIALAAAQPRSSTLLITDINLGRPAKCWDVAEVLSRAKAAKLKARLPPSSAYCRQSCPADIEQGAQHLPTARLADRQAPARREREYYLANLAAEWTPQFPCNDQAHDGVAEPPHQPKGLTPPPNRGRSISTYCGRHLWAWPERDRFWGTGASRWPSFSNAAEAALSNN